MTRQLLGRPPASAALLLPPTSRPPGSAPAARSDDLGAVGTTTRSRGRRDDLPAAATWVLWLIAFGATAVGGWLVAVRSGDARCHGPVCTVLTLGHPGLLLVLACSSVAILLGVAPFTRGLSRAGDVQLGLLVLGGATGAASLFGVVVVTGLAAAVAFTAVVAFVATVERS